LELEEAESLSLDPEQCAKARQELTTPRLRLACEIEWLPGLSPKRALDYADALEKDLAGYFQLIRSESGLPRANLAAAGMEQLSDEAPANDWAEQILALAVASDEIDSGALLSIINEDRKLADCPEIQSAEAVEGQLAERMRHFRNAIRESLDRMETTKMLSVVTRVVEVATDSGERRAPALLDELMDSYGLDARAFLEKEAATIVKIVDAAKDAVHEPGKLAELLRQLSASVANWTSVAKPIQMSMKSRGLVHDLTSHVGYTIRGLVLMLVNDADDIASGQKVNELLRERFSDYPELAERVEEDAQQLGKLARRQGFEAVLKPLRDLCRDVAQLADADARVAEAQGYRLAGAAPQMLADAERAGVDAEMLNYARDEVALAICSCAIDCGNGTSNWKACQTLLEDATKFARGAEAIKRIQTNMEVVLRNVRLFDGLKPITSAPSLRTVNACGFTLYGRTDEDSESRSYMATYYFVLLMIPIFPICRYRVISDGGNRYRFLGKGKLRTFDLWHIAISIGVILWLFAQK